MAADAPTDLNRLGAFIAVAQAGGFTAAAERLGISKARVSLDVQRLERALGLSLFTRTTRRVRLTDAGQQLLDETAPLLADLHDAVARTHRSAGAVSGSLRIAASVEQAAQQLAPLVAEFALRHPALKITLQASDRVSDMLAEGIDVSFRMGWLRDSTLRAVRLGEFEQFVVASPAYLQRAGAPRKPEDLAGHDWIALTLLPTPLTWRFTARNGHTRSVRMNARLQTDSATALRAMLLAGAGVTVMDRLSVQADLAAGRIERLLPDWRVPSGGVFAVYPPGRHLSAAAQAFVEFYRARWSA
ncbi:LysR family transcriptional regulator [Ideonella sp.]|uniref:LysR family transcriptional regulator n=1 Tax=Ideonella sp. TaxID=1929293 RepID=UPI002B486E80|nr:LysR family transcriptional regulator [Ideonella sp.]HJV68652.1 LysR family transcriptional regulator [Ideonella sp.]